MRQPRRVHCNLGKGQQLFQNCNQNPTLSYIVVAYHSTQADAGCAAAPWLKSCAILSWLSSVCDRPLAATYAAALGNPVSATKKN